MESRERRGRKVATVPRAQPRSTVASVAKAVCRAVEYLGKAAGAAEMRWASMEKPSMGERQAALRWSAPLRSVAAVRENLGSRARMAAPASWGPTVLQKA
jgi:hypothetical protein